MVLLRSILSGSLLLAACGSSDGGDTGSDTASTGDASTNPSTGSSSSGSSDASSGGDASSSGGTTSGGPETEPGVCFDAGHGEYWCDECTPGDTEACDEGLVRTCLEIDGDVITHVVWTECGECVVGEVRECTDGDFDGVQVCRVEPGPFEPPARPPAPSWEVDCSSKE